MKCYSKPIVEHSEVPLSDDGRLEKMLQHWKNQAESKSRKNHFGENTCYVVSISSSEDLYPDNKLGEILGLVEVLGDNVVGQEMYLQDVINPKTYLGKGIAVDMAARAVLAGANMLVLDAQLTPSQARNLEQLAGISICDREAVILNVFLLHAKTRLARNQVEIAHLQYLRPRIRGLGMNMDQQAGGIMRGKGPGETASELMARRLDDRLAQLKRSAKKLQQAGINQRKSRKNCKRISLIGYTNAGKTSLMNALIGTELSARDLPFETLDTTTRALSRKAHSDILLSDTVGLIRALPDHLLASFESTLAETLEADLLVIVVDAADPEVDLHLHTTQNLLERLGADLVPRHYVFNKVDKLVEPIPVGLCRSLSRGHAYSAVSSDNKQLTDQLRQSLIERVIGVWKEAELFVPYGSTNVIAEIYKCCIVLQVHSVKSGMHFIVKSDLQSISQLKQKTREAIDESIQ